jgi:hypothetical protein
MAYSCYQTGSLVCILARGLCCKKICWDTKIRLCCKNHSGYKNTKRYFSSGDNLEEIGHESNLFANVAFPDSFNLSLPDHVHELITADSPSRRLETEEAESGIDSAFYESVILLDDIIEIFALA